MLHNYIAAALRHLARNPLYSSITILGLAIGLGAAALAGATLRSELTHEHFIPGYARTYLAAAVAIPTGHEPLYNQEAPAFVAALLKLNLPQIRAVTRIAEQDVKLRQGRIAANEKIYWADPNAFDVLPLPVLAGNPGAALRRADGIVLTRSIAQKYFGRDDPLGQTVLLDEGQAMTVGAVIEDLPASGTELASGIFASGLAARSELGRCDRSAPDEARRGAVSLCGRAYLELAPGTRASDLQAAIDRFLPANYPKFPGMTMSVQLIRIDRVHLFQGLNPGMESRLAVSGAVALAILFGSCVIFVNLSTARSARRALEVAVRKACGASRTQLVVQFLGESLLYTVLAAALGLALANLALPSVNAFLNSGGHLGIAQDPALAAAIGFGILVVATLAGIYPALVLSGFRPGQVLKGVAARSSGAFARQALVVIQFAVLIGLLIAAAVFYRQRVYAIHDALRVDTDQMLIIRSPCKPALLNELRALRGVRGAYCSSEALLERNVFSNWRLKDGSPLALDMTALDFGAFDLYGVVPLAGTLARPPNAPQVVINEAAVRRFGFASAAAAIGQPLPLANAATLLGEATGAGATAAAANEIVAVVPDFAFDVALHKVRPTLYTIGTPDRYRLLNVKLAGRDIPETLAAIDRVGMATGGEQPPERFFLSRYIEDLYLAVLREERAVGGFAVLAAVLACLGLLGLCAATAESRTKEIGVRKAMGAGTADIVRMLLWQFSVPVLWASLLACLVSAVLLQRWLEGFADHVRLNPLVFVAAAALALTVALATVLGQSLLVARARPVEALRYE